MSANDTAVVPVTSEENRYWDKRIRAVFGEKMSHVFRATPDLVKYPNQEIRLIAKQQLGLAEKEGGLLCQTIVKTN
jgi:hypothetical protein